MKNASKRKMNDSLTLKTFKNYKLSCLTQKIFLVKKNPKVQIVFLELLDLHGKKATLPKKVFFGNIFA